MIDRLDNSTEDAMNEGRGLCRVLAVGVLLVAATVAGCVFTGCASILDSIGEADIRPDAERQRAVLAAMDIVEPPQLGAVRSHEQI